MFSFSKYEGNFLLGKEQTQGGSLLVGLIGKSRVQQTTIDHHNILALNRNGRFFIVTKCGTIGVFHVGQGSTVHLDQYPLF